MEKTKKVIYFVRHGESITNIAFNETGTKLVCFDPPLSAKGRKQARLCAKELMELEKEFDLIISSPLTRAIETCKLYLKKSNQKKREINIMKSARERLITCDDIGSSKYVLMKKFTNLKFIEEMENEEVFSIDFSKKNRYFNFTAKIKVWYTEKFKTTKEVCHSFLENPWRESLKELDERVKTFKQFLMERSEKRILVFTHGDFLSQIVGYQAENCEIIKTEISFEQNNKGVPFQVVYSSKMNIEYFKSFWEEDLSE